MNVITGLCVLNFFLVCVVKELYLLKQKRGNYTPLYLLDL